MSLLFDRSLLHDDLSFSGQNEILSILTELREELGNSDGVWVGVTGDSDNNAGPQTITGFFSPDPDRALRWLCASTTKPRLLAQIREIYGEGQEGRSVSGGSSITSNARRRPPGNKVLGTRQTNRKIREKALTSFAAGWQDSQGGGEHTVEDMSDQDIRRAQFLSGYPGLGQRRAGEMIKRASVVATWAAFEDWSVIMRYWRCKARKDSVPTDAPTETFRVVDESDQEMDDAVHDNNNPSAAMIQSQLGNWGARPRRLDACKRLYFTILNSEASEGITILRNRWLCSFFYKEAQRREDELRSSGTRTGRPGVSLMTMAKEIMFNDFYGHSQGSGSIDKVSHPREWDDLSRVLERGSRWAEFENAFGPGIFLLLGYSSMPNTFVERTLHADQVKIWIQLLQHCDPALKDMATKIEPIFQACMANNDPPREELGLEKVQDWTWAKAQCSLSSMLETEPVLQQESGMEG